MFEYKGCECIQIVYFINNIAGNRGDKAMWTCYGADKHKPRQIPCKTVYLLCFNTRGNFHISHSHMINIIYGSRWPSG